MIERAEASGGAVPGPATLDLVLITGISGSGKSIALHALEDVGYFCVDNLPPELLASFVELQLAQQAKRVAVAVDVRSAASLPLLPQVLKALPAQGVAVKLVFLEAATQTLVQRFSETRRRHPLSSGGSGSTAMAQSASGAPQAVADGSGERALIEAIELERHTLADLRELARVIDTTNIRPAVLQTWLKELVQAPLASLNLIFESFAFKNGVPLNADFVFDVRSLPNPHYTLALRPLTGRDQPVVDYLAAQPEVLAMVGDIQQFLKRWLPSFANDHRSYVTVAIGCTGGQHRSVYIAQRLAKELAADLPDLLPLGQAPLVRHRELK